MSQSQYFHGGICRIQYPVLRSRGETGVRITFSNGADKYFTMWNWEGIKSFLMEHSPSEDFAINMMRRIRERLNVSDMFKGMF